MPKAKNLKYCRQKIGLSQQAFADAIGVDKSTIIAWERKKRAIPATTTHLICDYVGVSYDVFCDIDLEKHDKTLMMDDEHVTYDELQQLLKFRKISKTSQEMIRSALDTAYKMDYMA